MLDLSNSRRVGVMYNKDINVIFDVGCFKTIVMGLWSLRWNVQASEKVRW